MGFVIDYLGKYKWIFYYTSSILFFCDLRKTWNYDLQIMQNYFEEMWKLQWIYIQFQYTHIRNAVFFLSFADRNLMLKLDRFTRFHTNKEHNVFSKTFLMFTTLKYSK